MNKVSYANLKLKVSRNINTFEYCGNKIEVLKYLPISDKYDLIMVTLQKSEENGIYNPLKLEMYFHLHLIYMYTNLSFTEKQKEDEFKIYDTLETNGFIEMFLDNMTESEYNFLFKMMTDLVNSSLKYKNSAAAVLQSLIQDLPRNAEIAADIVNNFDKEKYQEVINFAQAANGGRPIRGARANMSPIDEAAVESPIV